MCQCVAVCYSVLQRVAVCYSVLQRVAVRCSALVRVLQCVAVRCSALKCVAPSRTPPNEGCFEVTMIFSSLSVAFPPFFKRKI